AAMTGFGKRSILRMTLLPKRMNASTSPPENAEPRSAPPQKILSPAPVMITERTPSSSRTEFSASFTSWITASLIALAGGRLSVMVAYDSSRASTSVSNPIACDSSQKNVEHRLRGVVEPIAPLTEHPGRGEVAQGTEEHVRGDLPRQLRPEPPGGDALLENGADEIEVGRDLLRGGAAKELLPLPELELHHLRQLGPRLQRLEVQAHEPTQFGRRIRLSGDFLAQRAHPPRHFFAEQRDEDLVLGLEVEIDRAAGDARLARDVGHTRIVEPVAREHAHGGVDDLLRLVGVAHR